MLEFNKRLKIIFITLFQNALSKNKFSRCDPFFKTKHFDKLIENMISYFLNYIDDVLLLSYRLWKKVFDLLSQMRHQVFFKNGNKRSVDLQTIFKAV